MAEADRLEDGKERSGRGWLSGRASRMLSFSGGLLAPERADADSNTPWCTSPSLVTASRREIFIS
jgi:hypothetical protein